MRKLTVLGFVLLFFAAATSAQTDSQGNIAFGFSYARASLFSKSALAPTISSSNLNGWFTSGEYKVIPWLGVVGDFGGNYGTERVVPFCEVIPICPAPLNAKVSVQTFLAGPRASAVSYTHLTLPTILRV